MDIDRNMLQEALADAMINVLTRLLANVSSNNNNNDDDDNAHYISSTQNRNDNNNNILTAPKSARSVGTKSEHGVPVKKAK